MTKFIILSTQRSGTEMLRQSLDAVRGVFCTTELLNGLRESLRMPFVERFFHIPHHMVNKPDAFGMKIMLNQLGKRQLQGLSNQHKMIFLKRNIEEIIVSNFINKQRLHKGAHSYKPTKPIKVTVPLDFAEQDYARIQKEWKKVPHNVFEVCYDEIKPGVGYALKSQEAERVLEYLGLDKHIRLEPPTHKQNGELCDIVVNYKQYINKIGEMKNER